MKIVPLGERPDLLAQVAAWTFAEWGHLSRGQTLAKLTARIATRMNVDRAPVTFVALDDDGRALGTAALMYEDLKGDPRDPWLASVYVPPQGRGKGVGSALVVAVEDAARRFGFTRLYLFTVSSQRLYARLGWRALERRDYRGEHIQVMDRTL